MRIMAQIVGWLWIAFFVLAFLVGRDHGIAVFVIDAAFSIPGILLIRWGRGTKKAA